MFLHALDGLNDDFILEREDTSCLVLRGFDLFEIRDKTNLVHQITNRKNSILISQQARGKEAIGDYLGAIADYSKAIELEPEIAALYYNRGTTESELGKYRDALADYSKAIELDPGFGDAYHNRGGTKFRLKDTAGAIKDYTKAVEINPTNALAFQDLEKFRIIWVIGVRPWRPFKRLFNLIPRWRILGFPFGCFGRVSANRTMPPKN